jgi:hypothetical protein
VIHAGILRAEPHLGARGPGLFAGSLDWHSCVHAHWALACMTRACGDDRALGAFATGRLDDRALDRERQFLREHPRFERPYGRAWLLLLCTEALRRAELSSATLTALRDELWRDLARWLSANPFPETPDRASGLHDSWLFALLLLSLAAQTPGERRRARALYEDKAAPHSDRIAAHRPAPRDFIDLPALAACADAVTGGAAPPVRRAPEPFDVELADPHAHGRVAMRLWPVAIAAGRGDADAASRLGADLSRLLAEPARWRDDFRGVSHWVPQFVWMAAWLALGRP